MEVAGSLCARTGLARSSQDADQAHLIAVYENHAQDSRVKELDGVCTTVHAKYGMGGGNIPLVTCMSSGQANAEIVSDGSPSLTCLHEAPIVAIQGTVIGRSDIAGPQGSGANDDGAMFTLTKTDQHAVAIRTGHHGANGHGFADEVAHGLDATGAGQAVAFQQNTRDEVRLMGGDGQIAGCLSADLGMKQQNYLANQMAVRRLVPVETERLQGFEDDHTNVPYRGKPTSPDGPRYKAIGNSMATNCMEWIGLRIEMVNHSLPPDTQDSTPAGGIS